MNERKLLHIINDISGKRCTACIFSSIPGDVEPCSTCFNSTNFTVNLTRSSRWLIGEDGEYICEQCRYITRNDTKYCPQCGGIIVDIERYKIGV